MALDELQFAVKCARQYQEVIPRGVPAVSWHDADVLRAAADAV